jgi:tRNA(Ile)-lysidine synthase
VIPFIDKVRETIARHTMLVAEDRILVGASGGADSTALVLVLHELGYDLAVAHVNHNLRGAESDGDEQFVKNLANELNVSCFLSSVAVSREPGNLEAAGREARRRFFKSVMQGQRFSKLALAHNREDRIETFLLNLMRGAGSEGLVSMAPVAGGTVRPLVEISRKEIEEFLKIRGRLWRTDHTNADMSFARNRMRHEVLPRLASLFNTRLVETLARTLVILEDEDHMLGDLTRAWLKEHAEGGRIDAGALQNAPPALTRRLIREGLRQAGSNLHDLTFEHVEAVRSLLEEGKSGKMLHLPGGIVAAREFDRLVLSGAGQEPPDFQYQLPIPGRVNIPELGCVVTAERVARLPESPNSSPDHVFVDGGRLGPYVKIRNWKPGDYYKPAGWPGGKVKKLFQKARVPKSRRRRLPVFETDSTIIWVTSFPVSREFAPSTCSEKIVAFEARES